MANSKENKMVVREEPQRSIGLWEDMDDLFNSFRRDMERMIWDPFPVRAVPKLRVLRRDYRMPMDLVDEGENYKLTVDLPGVKKDDVKISINEGILSVNVEGKEQKEEKSENYLMKERSSYACSRKIQLPGEVDEDKVKANIEEGVLNIRLPKREPEKHKPREIKIE